MRCIACNKNLNDFESTRKSLLTDEYLDMCNSCYHIIEKDTPSKEREDLRSDEDSYDNTDDPEELLE